jgi:hypothetical protein
MIEIEPGQKMGYVSPIRNKKLLIPILGNSDNEK